MDTNTVIDRKLIGNPLPNSFQNPLSRRGKGERTERKVRLQTSPPIEEDTKQEEPKEIEETEEREPSTPKTSINTFDFAAPIQVGRGRPKNPKAQKQKRRGKTT